MGQIGINIQKGIPLHDHTSLVAGGPLGLNVVNNYNIDNNVLFPYKLNSVNSSPSDCNTYSVFRDPKVILSSTPVSLIKFKIRQSGTGKITLLAQRTGTQGSLTSYLYLYKNNNLIWQISGNWGSTTRLRSSDFSFNQNDIFEFQAQAESTTQFWDCWIEHMMWIEIVP